MPEFDWLRAVLTIPIVATALTTLLPLVAPGARWTRRLKSDLTIAKDLPDGPERDAWMLDVTSQARRIRHHRTHVHPVQRFLRWAAGASFIGGVVSLFVWGTPPDFWHPTIFILTLVGGGSGAWALWASLTGNQADIRAGVKRDRMRQLVQGVRRDRTATAPKAPQPRQGASRRRWSSKAKARWVARRK